MAQSTHTPEVPKYGQPAPIARLFGWFMIAALGAFLINNVLIVAYEMPTATAFLSDGFSLNGMVTPAVYLIAFIIATYHVLTNPDNALRYDAAKLHRFNTFLVRAMFWSVFFVGLADAIVAFMRVENIFVAWLGEEQARAFGRSAFVAPYMHMPMIALWDFCRDVHAHAWLHMACVVDCRGRTIDRSVALYLFIRTGLYGRFGALLVRCTVPICLSLHII